MREAIQNFGVFWSSPLRQRLLISVIVIQALLTVLVFFSLQDKKRINSPKMVEQQIVQQAILLAAGSGAMLADGNLQTVKNLLEVQSHYGPTQHVSFLKADRTLLATAGEGVAHDDGTLLQKLKGVPDAPVFLQNDQEWIDVAVPVVVSGQPYGWLRIAALKNGASPNHQTLVVNGIAALVLSVLFGMGMIYVCTYQIDDSLQRLVEVANRFRSGERDLRVKLKEGDRLEPLSQSFNALADKVSQRERELFHQREHLEEVVLERTRDLVHEVRERQAAEDQVKLIVSSAIDGIVSADVEGNILSSNPAAAKMFGYSVAEMTHLNVDQLLPPDSAVLKEVDIQTLLEQSQQKAEITSGSEVLAIRKNGETFSMEVAISQYMNKNSKFYTAVVRDITARKEAETKLRDTLETLQHTQNELVQSEKMASLGGLVAGIAHEINTPIGVGVTAASHLHERALGLAKSFEEGSLNRRDFKSFLSSAIESTQIILSNLSRGSDLIKSFKQVAVDQSSEAKREFYLLDYIEEVLRSLQPQLRRYQHIISVEGERTLFIESYPGPIAQIITNLVMNSVLHAFDPEEQGQITISAQADADMVCLTYSDNGKGMDEETVSKVFDPFFTTQRGTGGSGLGMHILFNQVTQTLGGSVKCSSKPGEGATFVFLFPVRKGN